MTNIKLISFILVSAFSTACMTQADKALFAELIGRSDSEEATVTEVAETVPSMEDVSETIGSTEDKVEKSSQIHIDQAEEAVSSEK